MDNDSDHNFAVLADQFLEAARFTNAGFKGRFEWPTYFLALQALELYLKGYLIRRGKTVDYVRKTIGHDVQKALAEAHAMGLSTSEPPEFAKLLSSLSDYYRQRDFQYRSIGGWTVVPPDALISFVETVSKACGN